MKNKLNYETHEKHQRKRYESAAIFRIAGKEPI
jgi:hypothetical protein